MAGLKQTLKFSQQLVMTPQLQQAIKLLQLSRLELEELVTAELTENPLLEEEAPSLEGREKQEIAEKKEEKLVEGDDNFDWQSYVESYSTPSIPGSSLKPALEEAPIYENIASKKDTLTDHLHWQLKLSDLNEEEQNIGAYIIGNLNDDGYLTMNIDEIIEREKWEKPLVEKVLKKIQSFDPVGVASITLQDCLLAQIELFEIEDPLVSNIVKFHLNDLQNRNYAAISKALKVPQESIVEAVKVIHELEPKPGRSYSSYEAHYITPDVYIYKIGEDYVIVLNEDGLPKLKISAFYRNLLKTKDASTLTKDYIQDKLRSAIWLIRSIHQRQRTIYKVTESIVKFQKEFLDKGLRFLKPMVLRDVAADIGMHESTVSRVTTNKFVHTPRGIFELKYFFNTSVSRTEGEDIAAESVKHILKEIVAQEDPKQPFSDQKLVDLLKEKNINIARRTIAKYRDMLGILPSSKRKKMF